MEYGVDPINLIRARNRVLMLKLVGAKCQECGYDRYLGNLSFHHIGEKSFSLDNGAFRNKIQGVIAEARKCVVYCHNCHGEFHGGVISDRTTEHNLALNNALDKIRDCRNWNEALDLVCMPRDYRPVS